VEPERRRRIAGLSPAAAGTRARARAIVAIGCVAALTIPAPALGAAGSRIPGRYIVVYDPAVKDPGAATERRVRSQGFRVRRNYREAIKGFTAELSARQVARLRDDPAVDAVVPDRVVRATAQVPLASGEPQPPTGARRVETATSTTTRQASTARVAVIDTGIQLDHLDLVAASATNCVGSGPAADDQGHGTHVAGTIGARNQGSGVVGIAPGTNVYAVKVLSASGSGSTSSVICGIDWVANTRSDADPANDIDIANLSLGGLGPAVATCAQTRDPMHQAICRATARGVTFVVAAGNDGIAFDTAHEPPSGDPCHSDPAGCPQGVEVPASYPEVLTVSAMADNDGRPGSLLPSGCYGDDGYAAFSNFAATAAGAAHTIAAPGACIRSTKLNGTTTTMSGTSMAAPHVAGLAALCLGEAGAAGRCAGLTPAGIIQRLRADALDHTGQLAGYGFVGDPTRPAAGRGYLGYLAWAPPSAPAPPPDTQPPAPTLETPPGASSTSDTTPTFSGTAGVATGDAGEVTVEVFSGTTTQQLRLALTAPAVGSTWSVTPQTALGAGIYTALVSQRDTSANVGRSATSTFTVTPAPSGELPTAAAPGPANPPAAEPAPAGPPAPEPQPASPPAPEPQPASPPAAPPANPPAPDPAGAPVEPSATPRQPAGLEVVHARLLGRSLDVLATLRPGATGHLRVALNSGGRTTRVRATIHEGRVRIRRRLARAQAARGSGVLTLTYAGSAATRPQQVRLLAAPGAPLLRPRRPRLLDGHLLAGGTVVAGARGAVRVLLEFTAGGRTRSFEAGAPIRDGRWRLDAALPDAIRAAIDARDGVPRAHVLFAGFRPLRIGGQLRSFEVAVGG
jgi:subtilisin